MIKVNIHNKIYLPMYNIDIYVERQIDRQIDRQIVKDTGIEYMALYLGLQHY